jgi:quercetin dioxygenase-like cupin family protein
MKKAIGILFVVLCVASVPLHAEEAPSVRQLHQMPREELLGRDVERILIWGKTDGAYQAMVKVYKGEKAPARTAPRGLRLGIVSNGWMTVHAASLHQRVTFGAWITIPAGVAFSVDCEPYHSCWWIEETLSEATK